MLAQQMGLMATLRVFEEGVKSARGETAILGRSDHTRNMSGTSLHTTFCQEWPEYGWWT